MYPSQILQPTAQFWNDRIHNKDVFGSGEFHESANIVRIKEECWDFLLGFI